jgi:WD40 repeat protein
MVPAAVKLPPDDTHSTPATRPASPSPVDPALTGQSDRPGSISAQAPGDATRTSEPLPKAAPASESQLESRTAAPQLRDPKRYHMLGEHGRGGLGRVSRAHDRELGRDIAVKELISRGHVSEVRFLREALITARLEHPGIVPVYEAGRWPDGTPFYAMKLVAGRSLRDLLTERTTVDQRIALLHHVITVADAIAYAHDRHIIHRDLKPANVIVGNFGETVVIDWGLAKDLSETEESSLGGGPFRANRDDGLTSAGAVLGTPAYMAPEQERGEPVDQRADVFAIGAMLWELCALEKLPPSYAGQRHLILRRAGIDQDLTTIIDKALDPDPARRYPDAGALAADLKAFKAGARIAARRYSLLAMLVHWARRHRALTLSGVVVTVLAAIGTILYVQNIAIERDRADVALEKTEAAKDALTLEHAELLLHSDPTSALAALAGYHGPDVTRAKQISAEARGRGVARSILNSHSDTVYLLAGMRDGSILSVGEDRRIMLTKPGLAATLADDVAVPVVVEYSNKRLLLAYSSSSRGAVLLDLETQRSRSLSAATPYAIAFTADGERVAVLDQHSVLTVWSTDSRPQVVWQRTFSRAGTIIFSDKEHIIIPISTGFIVTSLSGGDDINLRMSASAYDAFEEWLVIGDTHGSIHLYNAQHSQLISSIVACREGVRDIRIAPQKAAIIFACQEGSAGVAEYAPMLSIRERFETKGYAFKISLSEDNHLAMVLTDSSIAYVHDLDSRLTRRYEGSANLSSASPPTSTYPSVLTGDINGAIRIWDAPNSDAYMLMRNKASNLRATFSPDGSFIAAGGTDGAVSVIRLRDRTYRTNRGHTSTVENLSFMPNGLFLSYGFDGKIIVWQPDDLSVVRKFEEHQARVEDIGFVDQGRRILSVGDDGRLLSWSLNDARFSVLFKARHPLTNVEVLTSNGTSVVSDASGAVWHVPGEGIATLIRPADGDLVTLLRASSDGHFVAIGTERGDVTILDSRTWNTLRTVKMKGPLRQGSFAPDNLRLVLASERRDVQIVPLGTSVTDQWRETSLDVRDVSFSPDGKLLALVCSNGGLWLYSFEVNTWTYVQDHYTLTSFGRFSPDGRSFVSSDNGGAIVVRDILATSTIHHNSR